MYGTLHREMSATSVLSATFHGARHSVDALVDAAVGLGDLDVAATHDTLRDLAKFLEWHVAESSGGGSLGERWDEDAWISCSMDVASYPHDGGGVEHTVDTHLGMVAHDESAKLQIGAHEGATSIIPDTDFAVVVFEIGGIDAGSYITPLPYHGVAEIAVVCFVAVSEDDGVVYLSSYFAVRTKGGVAVDLASHADGGVRSDT